MSARLQSLPGVSTGLGSAGVQKRVGGRTGIGGLLGGVRLCFGGKAEHWLFAYTSGRSGQWRRSIHWREGSWFTCLSDYGA